MPTAALVAITTVVVAVAAAPLLWSRYRARRSRPHKLDIRPIDPKAREHYREQWMQVQELFVDSPEGALDQADHLMLTVLGELGYPTEGFDELIARMSVEQGRTLDYYRRGHEISSRARHKEASVQDMRRAMVHYRAMFQDLLSASPEENI